MKLFFAYFELHRLNFKEIKFQLSACTKKFEITMNPEIYWFADLFFDFPPQDLEFQLSTWFDLQGCNILNTNMKIFTVADWLNQSVYEEWYFKFSNTIYA